MKDERLTIYTNSLRLEKKFSDEERRKQFFYVQGRNSMKTDNMMAVHQIHSVAGKKDILRDVVIKYIDHFYPE